ncbi:MAG: alpha/beta hydrolase [Acidobacteria bacterium]|nr:alpha/beta hydrolase [Acidobacteriota bacterium]
MDYRGYGRSEGQPSESGLYRDADTAYQYLLDAGYTPEQIVVYGQSLGSAVAVDLAARKPVRGVILEAPFPSISAVAGRALPVLGRIAVWGFDSVSKISRVRAPLLIIHGDRDRTVPFDLGESLFAAAAEPKSFWRVRGAGHNDLPETAGTAYRERLSAFYRENR